MDCDHISWAMWNVITQLLAQCLSSSHAKLKRSSERETSSNLGLNRGRVGKIGVFQPINRRMSETVRDRAKVTIDH